MIGTVGSAEKAELARAHGLDHAILYRSEDFVTQARRLTGGQGVDLAIDGTGGEVLLRTLDAVRPFGTVLSVGQVAGETRPLALGELGPARSLLLGRPSVFRYLADTSRYRRAARAVLAEVTDGLAVTIGLKLRLAEATVAHAAPETGRTTGSILLVPG
ncbi:zinc-binding dehydrogenase [Benzoatithermus flavus]|uniref:Zinc-binding dehydrogenase n=1 Tax=Benzoatithermus flavus TaxID=3108223 RepID=A0ABU8XUF6_9PROT